MRSHINVLLAFESSRNGISGPKPTDPLRVCGLSETLSSCHLGSFCFHFLLKSGPDVKATCQFPFLALLFSLILDPKYADMLNLLVTLTKDLRKQIMFTSELHCEDVPACCCVQPVCL